MNNSIKAAHLYSWLVTEGYTTDNLGTEQEFINAITGKEKAKVIYTALANEGYTKKDIGSELEFMKTYVAGWNRRDTIIHVVRELFSHKLLMKKRKAK